MTRAAGLDVGYSKTRRSSGIAIMIDGAISLDRSLGGETACARLRRESPFDVVAIDGPIVPTHADPTGRRAVEHLFIRGRFARRCKPGTSHGGSESRRLREAAGFAADRLAPCAPRRGAAPPFPAVRDGAVVEAFPNAFLGVCLDASYTRMPPLARGRKFDWLYEEWGLSGLDALRNVLPGAAGGALATAFHATRQRDERAALICLATALLVGEGRFTAIGDPEGGWFFLPPWQLWADWARDEVRTLADRLNLAGLSLEVVTGDLENRSVPPDPAADRR